MAITEHARWQDYLSYYTDLKARMEAEGWMVAGWIFEASEQPAFSSVSGQLSRANWYNQNRNGIHFDSSIGDKQLAEGVVQIMLHCHKDFPQQEKFIKLVAEQSRAIAENWEGCTLSPTSPFQPLVIQLPFTDDTLAGQLEKGFSQVKQLAPVIDEAIAEALQ